MRILIAEDDVVSLRFLESWVRKWGDEVVAVHDGAAAWDVLRQEHAPQLAILDWVMPHMDGLEVCARVRAQHTHPYTYIVLVTARSLTEDVVRGLEAGADDYVSKPINPLELRARLQTGRRILHLQEQLLAAQHELRIKATRDFLTGLWNRPAIVDMLEREIKHAARDRTSVGVIMADLDHFKRVNDTYGHQVGDVVLCETANRMRGALRQCDWIGRYGGEEFLVVLPRCDYPAGLRSAERVRQALSDAPIPFADGDLSITISMGMTTSNVADGISANELLNHADQALYEAKKLGRNRVEFKGLREKTNGLVAAAW